jgi:PknH-like extracellular domain
VTHTGRAVFAIAVATSVLVSGCVSTVAGTAVRAEKTGPPVDVPPLKEPQLNGVLLSIGELNGIVGSTQMTLTASMQQMTDHSSSVSDPDCLGAIYGAEEPVYAGTGWAAVRDQVVREPNRDNEHWVEQTAVLYPSADTAQKFFSGSTSTWKACSGSSISVDDGESTYLWLLDDVTAKDNLTTQMTTQEEANGWGCQHALSVVSNLTVETWACGYSISDEAARMASEMIANAAKK